MHAGDITLWPNQQPVSKEPGKCSSQALSSAVQSRAHKGGNAGAQTGTGQHAAPNSCLQG